MNRLALAVLLLATLPACGIVDFRDKAPEQAIYYIGSYNNSQSTAALAQQRALVVALEYVSPTGVVRDTLRNTSLPQSVSGRFVVSPTSWTQVFNRNELDEFRITAQILTPRVEGAAQGFVAITLMIDDQIVAYDTTMGTKTLSY